MTQAEADDKAEELIKGLVWQQTWMNIQDVVWVVKNESGNCQGFTMDPEIMLFDEPTSARS